MEERQFVAEMQDLIDKGIVEMPRPGFYQLTDYGVEVAQALRSAPTPRPDGDKEE